MTNALFLGDYMEKEKLYNWMLSMLPENNEYVSSSSASYKKSIQCFEAALRPLWAVLPVYFSNSKVNTKVRKYIDQLIYLFNSNQLPKVTTKNRQVAVEAEVLAYGLGKYRERFLNLFSEEGKINLVKWLNKLNTIEYPDGNWYFFLLLVNEALKINNLQFSETKLKLAHEKIESYYLKNGWYQDGKNGALDYYIAFVFHFDGMLYSTFCNDSYSKKYKERAVEFAKNFRYWFDNNGSAVPFGRSLIYRFAQSAFWSMYVTSGMYKEKNSFKLSDVKEIITKNLSFWQQKNITNSNSVLSLGYGYNQQLMTEDYNAPGSPMWAFKAFVLLDLSDNHKFWKINESHNFLDKKIAQKEPGFLIVSSQNQNIIYSCKQFPKNINMYQGKEKYCKFAYSSLLGFDISRNQLGLEGYAIDSTLAFSLLNHEQYMSKYKTDGYKVENDYLITSWHLWDEVNVTTYLIPINLDSHLRIHVIYNFVPLESVEGGFSLPNWNQKYDSFLTNKNRLKVFNNYGYSIIKDVLGDRKPGLVNQGPNTNLLNPNKNAIPILKKRIDKGKHIFITLVSGGRKDINFNPKIKINQTSKCFSISISGNRVINLERKLEGDF